MKIYTKTGDKGYTSLLGGKRVKKHNIRVEAYGSVDELNSWIGLLIDQNISTKYKIILDKIQNDIFILSSTLANPDNKIKVPILSTLDIEMLEKNIDDMEKSLPIMKNFIFQGGHQIVSFCNITRSVSRRCERAISKLNEKEKIDEIIIQYINRLSDYLFVLGRKISHDLKVEEKIWKTK